MVPLFVSLGLIPLVRRHPSDNSASFVFFCSPFLFVVPVFPFSSFPLYIRPSYRNQIRLDGFPRLASFLGVQAGRLASSGSLAQFSGGL